MREKNPTIVCRDAYEQLCIQETLENVGETRGMYFDGCHYRRGVELLRFEFFKLAEFRKNVAGVLELTGDFACFRLGLEIRAFFARNRMKVVRTRSSGRLDRCAGISPSLKLSTNLIELTG